VADIDFKSKKQTEESTTIHEYSVSSTAITLTPASHCLVKYFAKSGLIMAIFRE
jgi:hypothetical protein